MTTTHIDTVRRHLLEQMQALRSASADQLDLELNRARGISELAQVAVNTAKVEVDYLRVTEQKESPFIGDKTAIVGNGITSITRHRLQG